MIQQSANVHYYLPSVIADGFVCYYCSETRKGKEAICCRLLFVFIIIHRPPGVFAEGLVQLLCGETPGELLSR